VWARYAAGDWIVCPGYSALDRRATRPESDRRKEPRPCTYTFGRVQLGSRAWLRRIQPGEVVDPPPGTILQKCPVCSARVLLLLQSAEAA
jgi:hypothetical protein